MENDEALDLIGTLPDGSRYVAATQPMRAWTEGKRHTADVVDALAVVAWAMGAYDREAHPEPPVVARPEHALARGAATARSRRVRASVESGSWEEA